MKANVILAGPMSTGKTSSLKTIPAPYEVGVLALEPGIENILKDTDPERFHWKYIQPARPSWDVMKKNAERIASLSNEVLQKIQKIASSDYEQFLEVLNTCMNYKCDRCGKEMGAVDEWDDKKIFVIDGLSGLSQMGMDLVVGPKPIKTLPDYGVAQDNLERFISKCCVDTKCSFILMAHVTRVIDEVNGGTVVSLDTIGQKLGPKIPRMFDECIWTRRDKNDFFWSTIEANAELKTRLLTWADNIPQDFSQIFKE